MIKYSLKELQTIVKGSNLKKEYESLSIKGISIDSRQIEKGQLFVPIIGENFDGHTFIDGAIKNGAAAALWNEDTPVPNIDFPFILVKDTLEAMQMIAKEYRSSLKVKIVGITGSNGKTSTKDILAGLLSTKYKTKKTLGNFNNEIGVPLTIFNLEEDTEIAVIEMGTMKFGDISQLTNFVKPDVAIITSIGEAHLEDLKTLENVAVAKLEILEGLNPNGLFIYYGDDPYLKEKVPTYNIKQKVVTYGEDNHNDYQPNLDDYDGKGITFKFNKPESSSFTLSMIGKHQMYNATAAIIAAQHFGITLENVQKGFEKIDKTGMRNELIKANGFSILNDCYKSNPASVVTSLETLYSLKQYDQKIVVLGDMQGLGTSEIELHEEIGESIDPNQIEYIFTLGPISEFLVKKARRRFDENKALSYLNKPDLIKDLKKVIKPNALVLIKGSRGLELEEIVEALVK